MKAFKTTLHTGLILLSLAFLPERSQGQIYLTGLLQQGADSQTGSSLDSPIFTTEGGGETDFAVIRLARARKTAGRMIFKSIGARLADLAVRHSPEAGLTMFGIMTARA
jgi:hypothetical protein